MLKWFNREKATSTDHSVIRLFGYSVIGKARQGFTLIEMLVVIGIIAILVGASLGGFSAMTKSAENAKCQELVANTATALTALFQQEGAWPKRLAQNGATEGKLDAKTAYALVAGTTKYMSLSVKNGQLSGADRLGIVTPWAQAKIKRLGTSATDSSPVSATATIDDHVLRYALDLDGDGIIEGANVGGKAVDIRATAAVWCGGKDGVISPYLKKSDDIYSWTPGQTRNVK